MTPDRRKTGLGGGFLRSCQRFPDRTALEVSGESYSYSALFERAAGLAATMQQLEPEAEIRVTAVLAYRSVSAFAGVLGALLRGHAYVPLNPRLPAARTAVMLERSLSRTIIVGSEAVETAVELLRSMSRNMLVLCPDEEAAQRLAVELPAHRVLGPDEFAAANSWQEPEVDLDDTAYLLFTSGSTGIPKGVQVAHRNILRFIEVVLAHYRLSEEDRFSHMFELVFDLSLFDLFVAWECGACLCCPNAGDARLPARYLLESQITVWFSVPSLGLVMKQMRMLEPAAYPHLRLVLFCGEAALQEVVEAWAEAAPKARIENLYGPTEVTLCCTWYRWDPSSSAAECLNGVLPIGWPFPGMTAIVVDDSLQEVPPGEPGELLLSGPQVALGYWQDPDKTATAFLVPPGQEALFYRTGDLVSWRGGVSPIQYLGRLDHQIKIRGNRVELGEVEAILRQEAGVDQAVALGWPPTESGADGIVAFLETEGVDARSLKKRLQDRLPSYMVARRIRALARFPLNVNGKVDRKALAAMLDDQQGRQ